MSKCILLIDDDKLDRMSIKKSLQGLDVEIVELADGSEVVETIENGDFHCVLIDYLLPDIDGIALTKIVVDKFDVPTVVITGQGDEMLAVKALKAGARDYVPKSSLGLLSQAVSAVMREYDNDQLMKKYQSEMSEKLERMNQEIDEKMNAKE